MGVPIIYRSTGERPIASYSNAELASGLGFINFYLFRDSANVYGLSENIVNSDVIGEQVDADTATYTKVVSRSFSSSEFNLPRTIKGTAIITIPVGVTSAVGTTFAYISAALVHYDGTTETYMGNAEGSANPISAIDTDPDKEKIQNLQIDVEQHFKKGHQLLLKLDMWARETGTGSALIGYDPGDRVFNSLGTTKSIAYIPFKIDI